MKVMADVTVKLRGSIQAEECMGRPKVKWKVSVIAEEENII